MTETIVCLEFRGYICFKSGRNTTSMSGSDLAIINRFALDYCRLSCSGRCQCVFNYFRYVSTTASKYVTSAFVSSEDMDSNVIVSVRRSEIKSRLELK
jgi:hypothetical protein